MQLTKLILVAQSTAKELGLIHPSMAPSELRNITSKTRMKILDLYIERFFELQERNLRKALSGEDYDPEYAKLVHVKLKDFFRKHKQWAKTGNSS